MAKLNGHTQGSVGTVGAVLFFAFSLLAAWRTWVAFAKATARRGRRQREQQPPPQGTQQQLTQMQPQAPPPEQSQHAKRTWKDWVRKMSVVQQFHVCVLAGALLDVSYYLIMMDTGRIVSSAYIAHVWALFLYQVAFGLVILLWGHTLNFGGSYRTVWWAVNTSAFVNGTISVAFTFVVFTTPDFQSNLLYFALIVVHSLTLLALATWFVIYGLRLQYRLTQSAVTESGREQQRNEQAYVLFRVNAVLGGCVACFLLRVLFLVLLLRSTFGPDSALDRIPVVAWFFLASFFPTICSCCILLFVMRGHRAQYNSAQGRPVQQSIASSAAASTVSSAPPATIGSGDRLVSEATTVGNSSQDGRSRSVGPGLAQDAGRRNNNNNKNTADGDEAGLTTDVHGTGTGQARPSQKHQRAKKRTSQQPQQPQPQQPQGRQDGQQLRVEQPNPMVAAATQADQPMRIQRVDDPLAAELVDGHVNEHDLENQGEDGEDDDENEDWSDEEGTGDRYRYEGGRTVSDMGQRWENRQLTISRATFRTSAGTFMSTLDAFQGEEQWDDVCVGDLLPAQHYDDRWSSAAIMMPNTGDNARVGSVDSPGLRRHLLNNDAGGVPRNGSNQQLLRANEESYSERQYDANVSYCDNGADQGRHRNNTADLELDDEERAAAAASGAEAGFYGNNPSSLEEDGQQFAYRQESTSLEVEEGDGGAS